MRSVCRSRRRDRRRAVRGRGFCSGGSGICGSGLGPGGLAWGFVGTPEKIGEIIMNKNSLSESLGA